MRPLLSSEQIKELDLLTQKRLRISSAELMRRVGTEIGELIAERISEEDMVLILCGPGNNGGDGYVIAEFLRKLCDVKVIEVFKPQSKDAKWAAKKCKAKRVKANETTKAKASLVIDAIFGNGIRSGISPETKMWIRLANQSDGYKISIDVPTTGFIADETFVVAAPRLSFLNEKYLANVGRITYVGRDFKVPRSGKYIALEDSDFSVTKASNHSHKGDRGRCGIVGGARATPGAALLAAEAAHRAGSGYATVFFAEPFKSLKVKDASFILKSDWNLKNLLSQDVLVIGCGGFPQTKMNWSALTQPLVIDAEALPFYKKFKSKNVLLTPHPKEAAALLGWKTEEVVSNREAALRELVQLTNYSVYLKGAPGLLMLKNKPNKIYSTLVSNSIFAKAGSGDLLAGWIAGCIAQGSNNFFDGLILQSKIGEELRGFSATIASDQLSVTSRALEKLKRGQGT